MNRQTLGKPEPHPYTADAIVSAGEGIASPPVEGFDQTRSVWPL